MTAIPTQDFKSLIRRRKITDVLFGVLGFVSIAIGLIRSRM